MEGAYSRQGAYSEQGPGPFLEGPEKFSRPKSCGKISNFMIREPAVLFTYY